MIKLLNNDQGRSSLNKYPSNLFHIMSHVKIISISWRKTWESPQKPTGQEAVADPSPHMTTPQAEEIAVLWPIWAWRRLALHIQGLWPKTCLILERNCIMNYFYKICLKLVSFLCAFMLLVSLYFRSLQRGFSESVWEVLPWWRAGTCFCHDALTSLHDGQPCLAYLDKIENFFKKLILFSSIIKVIQKMWKI